MSSHGGAAATSGRLPEIPGYDGLSIVGRGGFATVYRAHQASFNRDVAIKVLDVDDVSEEALARFERECRAVGSLSGHPNIVTVFGAGTTAEGRPYIVMEFMDHGSLAARLKREKVLSPHEAVQIGLEILDAVGAAHQIGIIHRDIKPDNVLISRYGRPQIADFGISSVPGAYETRSGTAATTMAFAAPEVIDGNRAEPASDLYAVAATLATLIVGRPVFSKVGEDSLVAYINRVLREAPPDFTAFGASAELNAVLQRGLAKSAADRFTSAAEFRAALAAVPEATAPADGLDARTMLRSHLQERLATVGSAAAPGLDDFAMETIRKDFPGLEPGSGHPSGPVPGLLTGPVDGLPSRRRRALLWGGAAVAAVVVAVVAGFLVLSGGDASEPTAEPTTRQTEVPPVAPTLTRSCTGMVCTLSATAPAAGATYLWSFGDGTSLAGGASVKHRYHQTGTFAVSVDATVDGEHLTGGPVNVALRTFARQLTLVGGVREVTATIKGAAKCPEATYELQRQDGGWKRVVLLTPAGRPQKVSAPEAGQYRLVASQVAVTNGTCPKVVSNQVAVTEPVVTQPSQSTYQPPSTSTHTSTPKPKSNPGPREPKRPGS